MKVRRFTCINCPVGCDISVEMEGNRIVSLNGSRCVKGEEYVRKEAVNPTRIITSTVPVSGGTEARVPVKTRTDIPKDKIFACMNAIKEICVEAPVYLGDIIIENAADTNVDIIATRTILKES